MAPATENNADLPLSRQHCSPCQLGTRAMLPADVSVHLSKVPRWKKVTTDNMDRIQREYHFKDFRAAADFVYKLAALADREDHHPAVAIEWGQVTVTWWTHRANGLHTNDFIMAAKTDLLAAQSG
jgi:4a-hydroxytetrahydrobiopterin dehydratase